MTQTSCVDAGSCINRLLLRQLDPLSHIHSITFTTFVYVSLAVFLGQDLTLAFL